VQLYRLLNKIEYFSRGCDNTKPFHSFTFIPSVTFQWSHPPIKAIAWVYCYPNGRR